MDISNKIGIGLSVINIAGTVFFLERGFGIIGLMVNNVIVFTVMAVINIVVAHKLVPAFKKQYLGRRCFAGGHERFWPGRISAFVFKHDDGAFDSSCAGICLLYIKHDIFRTCFA